MGGSKVLVLGGTGPAGICLLRELVYRKQTTAVYARNPSKIPNELASNPLIEIIKGEMDDLATLSAAIAQSSVIISLLGPQINSGSISPTQFADYYKSSVFPLMRQHSVSRIVAMGTLSIVRSEDRWSFLHILIVLFVRFFHSNAYRNILNIAEVFEKEAHGLDWTVYRIAAIPGESDEASWQRDREDGQTFVGWVGEKGWSISQKRGALARWLVDAAEGGAAEWVGKMPAVSQLAGSKGNTS